MALPTAGSTAAAGSGFIQSTMSPAIAPVKAAGSALGNPLTTLGAPPVIMAAAAAMGTMFGGGGGKGGGKGKGAGGVGGGPATPPLASGFSGGPEPTVLLESILENTFHLEEMKDALNDIREWVRELTEKLVGQRQQPKGAEDEKGKKIGGQFMVKRKATETADPAEKLKAIEARREAARAKGKGKGGAGGGAGAEEDADGGGMAGIFGIGRFIGSVGKGIGKAIQGFLTGVAMGLAAFGNPMVLAGVAIIAASMPIVALGLTAMMKVFEHFGTSFEPMKKFIEALEPLFTFVGKIISEVIESLGKAIGHILRPLAEQLQILIPLFDTFMGTLLGFWESLERVMMKLMDSVVEALQILAPTLEKLADVLMAVLPPLVPVIANVVQAVREAIAGIVEIFHTIERTISTVLDKVKEGVVAIVTVIGEQVTNIFGAIKDLVVEVIDATVTGIERLAEIDGANLWKVGGGIASIAAGLALLGGGKVADAAAGVVSGMLNFLSGQDDPVEQLMKYAEIGPEIEQAGAAIFGIGKGLSLMGEANLDRLGEQLAQIKGPMEELSRIDISGPQAQVFAAMKESQLQASEQAAAASAPQGGVTAINAPQTTEINNVSGQTMIAAQVSAIKGDGSLEGQGLQP